MKSRDMMGDSAGRKGTAGLHFLAEQHAVLPVLWHRERPISMTSDAFTLKSHVRIRIRHFAVHFLYHTEMLSHLSFSEGASGVSGPQSDEPNEHNKLES